MSGSTGPSPPSTSNSCSCITHSGVEVFQILQFFALFQTSRPVLWNLVMKEISFEGLFPVRINQISDLIQFQPHLSCQSGLDLLSLSSGCLVCVSAAFRRLNEDRLDCCSPPPTPSPSTFLVFLQDEHPPRGVSPELRLPVCLFQREQRERRAPAAPVGVQAGLFFFYFPSTLFPLSSPSLRSWETLF